jgi:4-amino-4-deoxy-L-arabinose transferase-like glycosyltransferase
MCIIPSGRNTPSMQKPDEERFTFKHLLFVIFLYSILMLITNSWWGVIETSEARYAEIAQEMFYSHDYLHPSLLNIHHYHKPPLTYWITLVGYSLLGVTSQGARLFLVVAYFLQCLIVYRIAGLIFDEDRVGIRSQSIWAAFIYANLFLVLISVRALTTDAYNHLFILTAIWTILLFKKTDKAKWLYLTALLAGFAFLTKGPIIIIFLLPIYFLFPIKKEVAASSASSIHFVFAFLLFLLVGLSWYVYLVAQDKIFLDYFVMRHFVDRLVHAEVFMRHQPWYFYLLTFPALTLPWFIPFITNTKKMDNITSKMLIAWVIIPFIIFSISSSKLALYILPVCAGFALITAHLIFKTERNYKNIFIACYLILLIGFLLVPQFDPSIQLSNPSKVLILLSLLLLGALFVLMKNTWLAIWYSSILFSVTVLLFSSLLIKENEIKFNSIQPIADFIKKEKLVDRNLIVYNRLLPSLAFELHKPIVSLYDNNTIQRETQFEKNTRWKESLVNLSEPRDSSRVYVILQLPSVLICKGEMIQNKTWLVSRFPHQKKFSQWTIYY